ncbi:MAG: hypothetical protein K2N73_09915 [Lachnospiraceae bacterium]|nr:hypothetical protein [Lachnospiraceae bacterium]
MEGKQKRRKQAVFYLILFVGSLAFYLAWYLLDGIILTEDAPSYINMQSDREPGYCLYLWMFREIFGEELYLHAAVVVQCIVAALAACAITIKLTGLFSLNLPGSMGVLAVQYGITLLNRFVAQRRYSYFNSVETEGLAYSLWVFYFLCILGVLYKKQKWSVAGAVFWSVVLISIRKHMLITLVILLIVMVWAYIGEKGWLKAGIYALIICILGFAGTKLVDCSYNLMTRGVFAPHTGDSSFILGTELYLADEGMAEHISDAEHKELFLEIMRRADEKEYNIAYAGKGWQAIEDHYSSAYDRIKFDIVMVVIREHQEAVGISGADREADYNLTAATLMKELLLPSVPKLVKLYVCNVIHGFVTSVLKVHRLLNWAALMLYLLYAATMAWLCASRHRRMRVRIDDNSCNPVYFAVLVLVSIAVNVCFTSLTIYCQMRYMLYNTGLFYQAWWIMLLEILGKVRYCSLRSSNE